MISIKGYERYNDTERKYLAEIITNAGELLADAECSSSVYCNGCNIRRLCHDIEQLRDYTDSKN